MKKTILTIVGSALMVLSAVQLAAAAEQHHGKARHHVYSTFRNSNAFAAPAYGSEPELYSGGWSAPAGR